MTIWLQGYERDDFLVFCGLACSLVDIYGWCVLLDLACGMTFMICHVRFMVWMAGGQKAVPLYDLAYSS